MLHYVYERLLKAKISRRRVPECLAIVLSYGDLDSIGCKTIRSLIEWSEPLGIRSLALYTGEDCQEIYQRLISELKEAPADISLHTKYRIERLGSGGRVKMVISMGFGGKKEVTEAIKKLLSEVEAGKILPEEIDEKSIEANLRFSQKPDMVIRAGGKQLSDFMIWQAAYSELYFTEVNWAMLRKVDFLRAIRDYQKRERRFGK